jgi:hypothetical protein
MLVYRNGHKVASLYLPILVRTLSFEFHSFTRILDNIYVSMLPNLNIVNTTLGLNEM